MHQTLRKIVDGLDGKPANTRGQSLVEMTVTFPLLILMVLGLVEVGFLANNYMILMDVVRGAGRDAVNLNPLGWPGPGSPNGWVNGEARDFQRMDCDTDPSTYHLYSKDTTADDNRSTPRGAQLAALGYGEITSPQKVDPPFSFFDEVVCNATRSFAPLKFNDSDTGKDDIVVSVVTYALMDYNGFSAAQKLTPAYQAGPGSHGGYWVTVNGRWPLENRYCVQTDGSGNYVSGDVRDPFDFKKSFSLNYPPGATEGDPNGRILQPNDNQMVRGFVFTGKARDDNNFCYGSSFTVQDVEQRLNLDPTFNKDVPNGAVVIVEFFWQHHPLFFGPLFQGFTGNPVNDPVLHVWSWFPVTSAEPTPTPAP